MLQLEVDALYCYAPELVEAMRAQRLLDVAKILVEEQARNAGPRRRKAPRAWFLKLPLPHRSALRQPVAWRPGLAP